MAVITSLQSELRSNSFRAGAIGRPTTPHASSQGQSNKGVRHLFMHERADKGRRSMAIGSDVARAESAWRSIGLDAQLITVLSENMSSDRPYRGGRSCRFVAGEVKETRKQNGLVATP